MRLGILVAGAAAVCLAGCTSSASPQISNASTPTSVPTGYVKPLNLSDDEIVAIRRDVAVAFNDPTRPLFDPIAGAIDDGGTHYACGTVWGKAEAGGNPNHLPYAGMFSGKVFRVLAKGGTTAETRAAEDVCRRLGILPNRR